MSETYVRDYMNNPWASRQANFEGITREIAYKEKTGAISLCYAVRLRLLAVELLDASDIVLEQES